MIDESQIKLCSNIAVMKFGGTSVGSLERINLVVSRVLDFQIQTGKKVVVVVSAMSGETDRLIALAKEASGGSDVQLSSIPAREYHQILVTGEQVSAALTAMAFVKRGARAQSLLAHQVGLVTREIYGQHLIDDIDVQRMLDLLSDGIIPVVAGFQGVDELGDYTTLGRGGSDTTAVALAAALNRVVAGRLDEDGLKFSLPKCYIFTDVDGVYTALPSVCPKARKLSYLTCEEMLELASGGAKVLQTRSVSLAYRYRVPLVVCSTFSSDPGTEIVEAYQGMEDAVVSGITFKVDEAKITLRDLPDRPGTAASVFQKVSEAGVVVDMIVQSEALAGQAEISFTVPESSAGTAYSVMEKLKEQDFSKMTVHLDKDIAKLSVVGEGMRNHAGVAARMFKILGAEGINIEMITTSEIKISVVIKRKYVELATRVLHEAFFE